MVQRFLIVLRGFKNKLAVDLIGPVFCKLYGYFFQRIVFLLIPQPQVDVLRNGIGIFIVTYGDLIQGRVKQFNLFVDQF